MILKTPRTSHNTLTECEKRLLHFLLNGRAYTLIEIANSAQANLSDTERLLYNLWAQQIIKVRGNRKRLYYYLPKEQQILFSNKTNSSNTPKPTGMKYCRHCYHHLAGFVGVKLTEALVEKGWLLPQEIPLHKYGAYTLTQKGIDKFAQLGIDLEQLKRKGGRLTKQCLDFSERKNHLGGKLGDALLTVFIKKGWAKQVPNSREITITSTGKIALHQLAEINLD